MLLLHSEVDFPTIHIPSIDIDWRIFEDEYFAAYDISLSCVFIPMTVELKINKQITICGCLCVNACFCQLFFKEI